MNLHEKDYLSEEDDDYVPSGAESDDEHEEGDDVEDALLESTPGTSEW